MKVDVRQHAVVPLQCQRVATDEQLLVAGEAEHEIARADADMAGVGDDVQTEPVLRLSGNVSRAGGRTGITVLGLDADAIPTLNGWRSDFSALSPRAPRRRASPLRRRR